MEDQLLTSFISKNILNKLLLVLVSCSRHQVSFVTVSHGSKTADLVLKSFTNLFKVDCVVGEQFVSLIQNVDSELGISFKAASLQNINTREMIFSQDLYVLHFGQVAVHHYAWFFAMVCMVFRE